MFVKYNPNPKTARVGDCTVRAISVVLDQSWEKTFIDLCMQGLTDCDMPSANAVWGAYLRSKNFERKILPHECPDCYTVEAFAGEHRTGRYVLALDGHVVGVVDGNYFDTWDSGQERPLYYWEEVQDV